MTLLLTEAEIADLITMDETIVVLEEMFAARARGEIVNRPRIRVPFPGGNYNLMPAGWAAHGVVGHKSYTASAAGAAFHIALYATDGSGLLALMSGGRISGLRTGAATGLAVRALARDGSAGPVAVVGAGFQATQQVNGVIAATGATDVRVWSRSTERRERFVAALPERVAAAVRAVDSLDEALDGAPIVVVITKAAEPVLRADHLRPGVTVVAAGNNTWLNAELEPEALAAADLIVVDDVEDARLEAGELMRAAERGLVAWDRVIPLGDIIGGRHPGRTSSDQVVICELQGIGIEDVAVAEVVYRRALERGVGQELAI